MQFKFISGIMISFLAGEICLLERTYSVFVNFLKSRLQFLTLLKIKYHEEMKEPKENKLNLLKSE